MDKEIALASPAALDQGSRLDVFRVLVQAGPAGLPAGAIGVALKLPSATLSFHLKELKSSGLIGCERRGTSRIYRPDFSAVNELIEFLTANCCRGTVGSASASEGCDVVGAIDCESAPVAPSARIQR